MITFATDLSQGKALHYIPMHIMCLLPLIYKSLSFLCLRLHVLLNILFNINDGKMSNCQINEY